MVYITGGPGYACAAPQNMLGVTNFVLDKGFKLLCFDHRGFGMSNAITTQQLKRDFGDDAEATVSFLKLFRATEAVQDLEAIRMCLVGGQATSTDPASGDATAQRWGDRSDMWSIMGQSYGGYLSTTYLSFYPDKVREAWIFGGLPPVLETKPDNALRYLVGKVRERNQAYYAKYPEDGERVKTIVDHLNKREREGKAVVLPSGGTLSAGRFMEMGILFGFHGGLDDVHKTVLRVFTDLEDDEEISRPALGQVDRNGLFDDNIFYAVMHEALYCQGEAAEWAFDRMLAESNEFGVNDAKDQYLFTGEMVFKRAFDDYTELRPLKKVMDCLMKDKDWSNQYDAERLRNNNVPTFAAVYVDDMYVGVDFSMATAKLIRGCKTVTTNQFYHDAIRAKPEEVLKALFALRDDSID
jgi:pimeloyl-ACP methyl ester carboxylesterase